MTPPRKPAAFRIGDEDVAVVTPGESAPIGARVVVEQAVEAAELPPAPVPKRDGIRWGRLLWSALGGLVALSLGLMVDGLIRELFARNDALGYLGVGLAAAALVAVVAIVARETIGLARIARIDRLRHRAAAAAVAGDGAAALSVTRDLVALYRDRPDTARGRAAVAGHLREVIDGRDLLALAEADLLVPMDVTARRLVADAVKRVSLVTAISPRAIVDVLFVLVAMLGLIRKLADLYGGRPGLIGFVSLTRHVVTHLAVTGGMAIGDGLVQQIVGHGVAARLSARLGEGVINGMLTARVGLAAIEVCRPLPFLDAPRVSATDVMGGVMTFGGAKDGKEEKGERG